jgi:hypothetical protein
MMQQGARITTAAARVSAASAASSPRFFCKLAAGVATSSKSLHNLSSSSSISSSSSSSVRCSAASSSAVTEQEVPAASVRPVIRRVGRGSKLVGCGSAVPTTIISNDDLSKVVDTSDEWIAVRTGIRNRHVLAEGETVTSLSVEASKKALEMANVNPEDIDLLLLCTSTPDDLFGSAPQVNSIKQDSSQASDDTWTGEGGCEKNVCHLLKILWGSIACMHACNFTYIITLKCIYPAIIVMSIVYVTLC